MKNLLFELHITEQTEDVFHIEIVHKEKKTQILFCWEKRELQFLKNDSITKVLKNNEYQLRKILHNKRKDTFYIGFKLHFVLRNNKDVIAFNKLTNYIVLDKRKAETQSYTLENSELKITEVYTDGCYLEKYNVSGVATIIKYTNNKIRLYTKGSQENSSSLIELKAAILALEKLKDHEKLRLFTDSRYVIKGLTEWLINWKLNDWHTAQGTKVKNIAEWQYFDQLCNGKYIEFKWVKAHSQQKENTLCDFYANEAALRYFVEH
ncbi:MAG: ribonuclease HI [Bacteroidales bacterium]|nr:ribonuclease HI [Bacteroidales bacterium]